MKSKVVFLNEWVKTNILSKRFRCSGHCSICQRLTCDPVWLSLKTQEVRCTKCFDAEKEHLRASPRVPLVVSVVSSSFQSRVKRSSC